MRKRCTRQHFIEYLSYNYVEKQCLLARCTWERKTHDFSLDGFINTYNQKGEIENEEIDVQVKATEKVSKLKTTGKIVFDLSIRDLEYWLAVTGLVVVVLYDASLDKGFYLEIGDYFRKNRKHLENANKFVRVYFSEENVFDPNVVSQLRIIKNS